MAFSLRFYTVSNRSDNLDLTSRIYRTYRPYRPHKRDESLSINL